MRWLKHANSAKLKIYFPLVLVFKTIKSTTFISVTIIYSVLDLFPANNTILSENVSRLQSDSI